MGGATMGSFLPGSRLTALQRDLLEAFFARERRLFLTGGAALAGFYLGHRTTDDLDLFTPPGVDLADAARALDAAARAVGASVSAQTTYPDFRRLVAARGDETCVVDLVVDRAPMIEAADARRKDAGADPATVAWLLEQIAIDDDAPLPAATSARALVALRDDLVKRLRALAFDEATAR